MESIVTTMLGRPKQNNNKEIVLYGGDLKFPPCDQNFGQILLNQMALHSDKIAQVHPIHNISYTHGQIRLFTIRCALEMRTMGVRKGDVVTICGRNHSHVIIPFLAATYLGAISNPLHPNFSASEVRRMMTLTEPRMIFCDSEAKPMILAIRNELGLASRIVTFDNEFEPFIAPHDYQDETSFKCEDVDPENDNMFIVCTSGTTGFIKGVTIRHAAFYTSVVEFLDEIEEDERLLIYSPVSWVTSIWITGLVFYKGATKFICEYEPIRNLEIITEYKITWILSSPMLLMQMIRHPLFPKYETKIVETLRSIFYGGAAGTDEQLKEFRRVFPNAFLFNGYGSSEGCVLHVWFNRKKDVKLNLSKINSSGYPVPGGYAKVIDPDTGKTLGVNEPGEFLLKSPSMTKGYYKNPEATAEAIDKDGWYHSGDMVKFDNDNCFYVLGRYKEMLKYRCWQVSPAELEEVIRSHPAVNMVCVMGKPNEDDGEWPVAFIVKKNSMADVTGDDIIAFVNDQVADHQKLRGGVIFVDSLPMTSSGKVRRIELKKLIEG
ncbi:4-coumarate-CoA ligase 1-like [Chrysoperla carnea]|uniref:4-coumarate-CoA ligase 1-like n=1 Tax=Chrysoperla carnea TaxID=189513 RepID=UPI001D07EC03|nr:4-coumarate-CoA ligase 1-like [Chrysoperla carnea]